MTQVFARWLCVPAQHARVFGGRLWWIIAYGSTLWTRAFLASVSSMWAVALWTGLDNFTRPVYAVLLSIFGQNVVFALSALLTIHGLGMWWRTLSVSYHPRFEFALNLLGATIYCFLAFSIMTTGIFPAPAIGCALASALVAIRTQVNPERGWRGG